MRPSDNRRREMGACGSYTPDYLRTTLLENGYIRFYIPANVTTSYLKYIEYSIDEGQTWTKTDNSSSAITIRVDNLTAGSSVLWRGKGNRLAYNTTSSLCCTFAGYGTNGTKIRFSASGNLGSLLFESGSIPTSSSDNYVFCCLFYDTGIVSAKDLILPFTELRGQYLYAYMFGNCSLLTEAPALPATVLGYHCYDGMFSNCTSLTTAPELPATSLATYCYQNMFQGCISLTATPIMNVTSVSSFSLSYMFYGCTSLTNVRITISVSNTCSCQYMFYGCTSLTTVPSNMLQATTMSAQSCQYMFCNCTSLTNVPELPATTLNQYCYRYMFENCKALTTVPSDLLPATDLTSCDNCYYEMFRGCTALTNAPALPATSLAKYCYNSMFRGCTALTSAQLTLPATTLQQYCYGNMFQDCTHLTTAPTLPATTLVNNCYQYMFQGCSLLNSITCLATNISASDCTTNWVKNVASSGTFTKAAAMGSWKSGVNGIPANWTRVNAS